MFGSFLNIMLQQIQLLRSHHLAQIWMSQAGNHRCAGILAYMLEGEIMLTLITSGSQKMQRNGQGPRLNELRTNTTSRFNTFQQTEEKLVGRRWLY